MVPELLPMSPQEIAPETFLVPTLAKDPLSDAYIGAHSLVVRGAEPIVVDTGCALVHDQWVEQVFSVVAPEDVRWIYVSHDDHDHVGNLAARARGVPERHPGAKLRDGEPAGGRSRPAPRTYALGGRR